MFPMTISVANALMEEVYTRPQSLTEFPARLFVLNDGKVVFSNQLTDESPNVAATYVLETVNRG